MIKLKTFVALSFLMGLCWIGSALAVEQLINNCSSPLSAAITVTTSPVTFTIVGASCFPTSLPAGGTFSVLIDSEWMTVTAISGTSITATRPEAPSVAATHSASAPVWILETARGLGQLKIDAGAPQSFAFAVPGTPVAGASWSVPCPYTITFPANFSGTYPDANGRASCGTSPSESDTWPISINGNPAGSVQLGTTCTSTSGTTGTGVTFATTGGTAQTCSVGQRLTLSTPIASAGSVIGAVMTSGSTAQNTAGTLGLTLPTGAQAGDVLVACIGTYTGSGGAIAATLPTGFGYITGSQTTSCQVGNPGSAEPCAYSMPLATTPTPGTVYTWTWTGGAVGNSYGGGVLMDIRGATATVDTAAIGAVSGAAAVATVSIPYGPANFPDYMVTCLAAYTASAWTTAPTNQLQIIGAAAGSNVTASVGGQNLAVGNSGSVTGILNTTTGSSWAGMNIPLELGGAGTVSGTNPGFILAGHVSALP